MLHISGIASRGVNRDIEDCTVTKRAFQERTGTIVPTRAALSARTRRATGPPAIV